MMTQALLVCVGLLLAGSEHPGGWLWTVNLVGVAMVASVLLCQPREG